VLCASCVVRSGYSRARGNRGLSCVAAAEVMVDTAFASGGSLERFIDRVPDQRCHRSRADQRILAGLHHLWPCLRSAFVVRETGRRLHGFSAISRRSSAVVGLVWHSEAQGQRGVDRFLVPAVGTGACVTTTFYARSQRRAKDTRSMRSSSPKFSGVHEASQLCPRIQPGAHAFRSVVGRVPAFAQ